MNHKRFFRFNIPPMAAATEEVEIVGNCKPIRSDKGRLPDHLDVVRVLAH